MKENPITADKVWDLVYEEILHVAETAYNRGCPDYAHFATQIIVRLKALRAKKESE